MTGFFQSVRGLSVRRPIQRRRARGATLNVHGRALVVDDDEPMRELLEAQLPRLGCSATCVAGAPAALEQLSSSDFDVVLTDLDLAGGAGLALCERIAADHPGLPVVVLTSFGSLDTAVAAIRAGAWDFLTKPIDLKVLEVALERAVKHHALHVEVHRLRNVVAAAEPSALLGESDAIQRVAALIARVADSEASVLITGESGTGKEVAARMLHALSRRAGRPFVAVNCAALPDQLLESELFGHVKGAFTDARSEKAGLFTEADGGTLLLDEIGELPMLMQPKLLRALQERKIRPLGSTHERPFDARIVAATHRDLEDRIEERAFREDLFFRINVVQIALPPLRALGNDVLVLAHHFLGQIVARIGKQVKGLTPAVGQALLRYDWPGNVRELQNCIEHAVAFTGFDELQLEDLPSRVRQGERVVPVAEEEVTFSLEEIERRYILRVLAANGGKRSRAARVLGLDRKTLYRKLERWGALSENS